jgi:hypothetical protein
MKTNFQMLRELLEVYKPAQRGLLSRYEDELIKRTLYIEEMDILQLRNLRDFTVAYLGRSEKMEDWDRMSAITYCIDSQIVKLGGEV